MPAPICRDKRIGLFRSPAAGLVGVHRDACIKDRINYHPGSLNCVLAGKERTIAGHGIPKQPLVGRLISSLFIQQIELALVADKFLACALDACGERDGSVGENVKRR